jgi:hypothetical protein
MRNRPGFIGVGAAKAGTTSLHDLLNQHPDIYLPDFKEAHFFDFDHNFSRGEKWYNKTVFSKYAGQKIQGEITPSYIYFPNVPKRIFDTVGPDVKLIFMFRHPVGRAWSHFQMHRLRGNEKLSFEDAVVAEPERLKQDMVTVSRFSYMDRGFYSQQVERYLQYFPKENMHFIIFEEFVKDMAGHTVKLLDFLGVDQMELDYSIRSNKQAEQRNKVMAKMIHQPSKLKKLLRSLVPSKLAKKARYSLNRMNEGEIVRSELSPDLKNKLFKKYFEADAEKLSRVIEKDLSIWSK